MSVVKGFDTNINGEYIEGYLSDKEHFNGVLFLLKEPNTNGEIQNEFYFRKCLYKEENNSTIDSYVKYLRQILSNLSVNRNLENCTYANMIPYCGMHKESEKYKKLSNKERVERFESLLNDKTDIVFVCRNEFDAIIKEKNIEWKENCGIKYSNKPNSKRMLQYSDKITVYEIYHPSYIHSFNITCIK